MAWEPRVGDRVQWVRRDGERELGTISFSGGCNGAFYYAVVFDRPGIERMGDPAWTAYFSSTSLESVLH